MNLKEREKMNYLNEVKELNKYKIALQQTNVIM